MQPHLKLAGIESARKMVRGEISESIMEPKRKNDMRTLLVCVLLLAAVPLVAFAQDNASRQNTTESVTAEKWECRRFGADDNYSPVLIKLWRKLGVESGHVGYGRIRVGSPTSMDYFFTTYALDGLDKRWNWDFNDHGRATSSFIIGPDGTGGIYNFSGLEHSERVKPSEIYSCTRDGTTKLAGRQESDWLAWYVSEILAKQSEKEK